MQESKLKWCPQCKTQTAAFAKNKARRDGLNSWCTPCIKHNAKLKQQAKVKQREEKQFRDNEEWRVIPGYSKYEASTHGRIRQIEKKLLLTGSIQKGYAVSAMANNAGKTTNIKFHRIIASTFLPNPHQHPTVNHIDKNRNNNYLDNLEWASMQEQIAHQYAIGSKPKTNKGQTIGTFCLDDLPGEEWRDIKGDTSSRRVSNKGRLKFYFGRSKGVLRITNGSLNSDGYLAVNIQLAGGKYLKTTMHRLVAAAFIPNPDVLPIVNHKDGIKTNCLVENLEWVTAKQNIQHAYDNSLISGKRPIVQIDKNGEVVCHWNCIREAADKLGITRAGIQNVLCGKSIFSRDFHWVYEENLEQFSKECLRKNKTASKAIARCCKETGAVLATYASARIAANAINAMYNAKYSEKAVQSNVSQCARGKRASAYGFTWSYAK